MITKNTIIIFDDDQYINALLKGYCFANNIDLMTLRFNLENIKTIEKLLPIIVIVPLDCLIVQKNSLEIALLKRVSASKRASVFGLAKAVMDSRKEKLPWLDAIIDSPFDIGEFSQSISKNTSFINNIIERRTQGERRGYERRANSCRRNFLFQEVGYQIQQHASIPVSPPDSTEIISKHWHIDHRNKCLWIKGDKVELTPKEFELVELLASDINRIFTAEEIIGHLWPLSHRANKSDLYQYMHLLRKKIEYDPDNPKFIITVKGFGYRLDINNREKMSQHG